MGKMWDHFKTITKHKLVVFHECKACGLIWQGITHDLSKYSLTEFRSSAEYFQGDRSPIEAEKECCGYSLAWQHHMGHNPHHWEYWIDFGEDGEILAAKMPWNYVVEMVCDWIGAGKVYSGEKWTQAEPLNYYHKVRKGRHFHPDTEKLVVAFLELIRDEGLEAFHNKARYGGLLYFDYVGKIRP